MKFGGGKEMRGLRRGARDLNKAIGRDWRIVCGEEWFKKLENDS